MTRRRLSRPKSIDRAAGSADARIAVPRRVDQASRWSVLVRLAIVVCVALGFYWRIASYDFVYVDDDRLIVQELGHLTEDGALRRAFHQPYFREAARDHAYYRPIVTASYIVDASRSGNVAMPCHRTNAILHAAVAGLLFVWLRTRRCSADLSLIGGLVFALHPTLVEAVAWVPGRPDLLMTAFVLGAWILHGRARNSPNWPVRILQPFLWFLALLCKEAAILMPFVWWLEDYLRQEKPRRLCFSRGPLVGWAVAFGAYLVMRMHALPAGLGTGGISLLESVSNSPALVSSLGKILLPVQLAVLAIPEDTWLWPGAIIGAGIVWLWIFRGFARGELTWGLLAYLAVMLPSLPATSVLILECRLYLPTAIVIGLVLSVVEKSATSVPVVFAISLAIVGLFAGRSHRYIEAFHDRQSFADAAVRGSPHSPLAHRNLGVALHLAGKVAEARQAYQTALRLDDGEPIAHNNLGVIFMAEGKLVDAERELRRELAINPTYGEAHHNLAMVLRATQREPEAVGHWKASIAGNANDVVALKALYDAYRVSDPIQAEGYRRLLESHGRNPEP